MEHNVWTEFSVSAVASEEWSLNVREPARHTWQVKQYGLLSLPAHTARDPGMPSLTLLAAALTAPDRLIYSLHLRFPFKPFSYALIQRGLIL